MVECVLGQCETIEQMVSLNVEDTHHPISEDLLCPGPSASPSISQGHGKLSLSGREGLSKSSHSKEVGVIGVEKT